MRCLRLTDPIHFLTYLFSAEQVLARVRAIVQPTWLTNAAPCTFFHSLLHFPPSPVPSFLSVFFSEFLFPTFFVSFSFKFVKMKKCFSCHIQFLLTILKHIHNKYSMTSNMLWIQQNVLRIKFRNSWYCRRFKWLFLLLRLYSVVATNCALFFFFWGH